MKGGCGDTLLHAPTVIHSLKQSGGFGASINELKGSCDMAKKKINSKNAATPRAGQTKRRAAAASAGTPAAPRKLKRPSVLKGNRDHFLLVLTDAPDRVDGYELAQLICDGNEGAGDITPPTGLGKSTFHQNLMNQTNGNVPIATCIKGLAELKSIIRAHVSALGFEKGSAVYELSEAEFLGAVQAAKWKFVKFVHVEDE